MSHQIFRLQNLALLAITLFTACSRPSIDIDSSELENSAAKGSQVGLLEVHRANSNGNYGAPLGETLGESAFCTATLLENGTVLTSSDCLRNKDGNFEAKNMDFHIKYSGTSITKTYSVKSILKSDAERKIALLEIEAENTQNSQAEALSMQSKVPTREELDADLSTLTVSVPGPDKNGVSRIKVSNTVALTAQPKEAAPIKPSAKPMEGAKPLPETPNAEPTPPDEAQAEPPIKTAEEIFSRPGPVQLKGLQDGTWGAPVFYKGKIIGIVKNGNDTETNAQWILKK